MASDIPEVLAHLRSGRVLELELGDLSLSQIHACVDAIEADLGSPLSRREQLTKRGQCVFVWHDAALRRKERIHGYRV